MSFIAAITRDKLLCTEIIEGAYDATLFEEVMHKMLSHIRSDPLTRDKTVIVFMDNAIFHHHSAVLQLCQQYKVNVLFNAAYSPWLNPIEMLFAKVKKTLVTKSVDRK